MVNCRPTEMKNSRKRLDRHGGKLKSYWRKLWSKDKKK